MAGRIVTNTRRKLLAALGAAGLAPLAWITLRPRPAQAMATPLANPSLARRFIGFEDRGRHQSGTRFHR